MTARLESFQYLPRGSAGWGSGLLHFGNVFTVVQGANGAGKTPIMKGLMQALGHEVELPPKIIEQCEFAEVTILVDGRPFVFRRRLGADFEISINDGVEGKTFKAPAEYGTWFTALFCDVPRLFTDKSNHAAVLYANVLLPSISVDQDHGWTTDYWTPPNRNFILDQRQEVIRFLTGLPERHPFRARTEYDAAKQALERTERSIEMQRFILDRLRTNEHLAEDEGPRLAEHRLQLLRELESSNEILEAIRSTTKFFDGEIESLEAQRNGLLSRAALLTQRMEQLNLVFSELEGEEDILTANVQATDLLRQFCDRPGCQMFATSERSFGRSLLFLKDQIKDLKASDRELGTESVSIGERLTKLDALLSTKREERASAVNSSPQAAAMVRLGALTRDLVQTELRLAKIQQYKVEQSRFEKLLDRREQEAAAVTDSRLTGVRGANSVGDVRQSLSDAMQSWLVTLGTQNTRGAYFDDDFVLFVDGAKFATTTHQSGSTRTRIVLAFHAALLEVSLARGGNHPGWLFFDAPKQHELSQTDFDAYADRLQMIAARYPGQVQIVFSAADLKTQFQADDEMWLPGFTVGGVARFLGPLSSDELLEVSETG
jgi:prefoldin subunit 5